MAHKELSFFFRGRLVIRVGRLGGKLISWLTFGEEFGFFEIGLFEVRIVEGAANWFC